MIYTLLIPINLGIIIDVHHVLVSVRITGKKRKTTPFKNSIAERSESVYFVYFPLFGVLGGELVVATDLFKAVITSLESFHYAIHLDLAL